MLGSQDEESNVKGLPQKCGEGALEPGGEAAVPTHAFHLVPLIHEFPILNPPLTSNPINLYSMLSNQENTCLSLPGEMMYFYLFHDSCLIIHIRGLLFLFCVVRGIWRVILERIFSVYLQIVHTPSQEFSFNQKAK